MKIEDLQGWQFAAARAAIGWTTVEAAADAGIAELTLRKIEGHERLHVRHDPRNRKSGGLDAELVKRLVKSYADQGFELRTDQGGWPAAVVYTGP